MGTMADQKTERDKRLAAALRENLKRRKAGARELELWKDNDDRSS
jgi:hypothetical protein